MTEIILASSSVYRAQLLARLGHEFTQITPDIDETQQHGESAQDLVKRLAEQKARAISAQNTTSLVIGSDQVCTFDNQVCGKPHTKSNAFKQLRSFSSNSVEFYTALCVLTPDGKCFQHTDVTEVKFRSLSDEEIMRYIDKELPLDCAGAFKVESLGLSLFSAVGSTDPSALMGLPLIKLAEFLRLSGYQVP
ncbi:MAG: Maf family protein [Marinicella sp.]